MIPRLREHAGEAEQLRKMSPASVEALRKAGLFRVLQPRRIGGLQQSLRTHIDVIATVARGCGASGWCMGVMQAHSWLIGHFAKGRAGRDLRRQSRQPISAAIAPRGQLRPVEDGYVLNGLVWLFGSGCQYSDWLLLGAALADSKGEIVDEADELMPTSAVTIKDDWNVVGLRGTGSCTIVAKDVHIPKHRYLRCVD